jgi:hypothetical protein
MDAGKDLGGNQPVIQDDISLLQNSQRLDRQ